MPFLPARGAGMTADADGPLCGRCRKAPCEPGRSACRPCLRNKAVYVSAKRAARRAAGLCIAARCDGIAEPGKSHCRACLASKSAERASTYQQRKEAGLCAECGKCPALPGLTRCAPCNAINTARQRRFKARTRAGKRKPAASWEAFGWSASFVERVKARHGPKGPATCAAPGCRLPRQPGRDKCAACIRAGLADNRLEIPESIASVLGNDPELPGAAERACARCGKSFQPTLRRRLLCDLCFRDDSTGVRTAAGRA